MVGFLEEAVMANRREFSSKTRKEALKRSLMRCEAVGGWYGLPASERCTNDLAYGVEYDHVILDANSKDNSLENCAAVCPKCHSWKTANRDTPTAAKTVRQSLMGMKTRPKQKIPQPTKAAKPSKYDWAPELPRRSLYVKEETA
jgi:hypothetical protein